MLQLRNSSLEGGTIRPLLLQDVFCSTCGARHVDLNATVNHVIHVCQVCGQKFCAREAGVGNTGGADIKGDKSAHATSACDTQATATSAITKP